jgi:hypothetical protein
MIGQICRSKFTSTAMSDIPPPFKRGRMSISIRGLGDRNKKYQKLARQTVEELMSNVHELLGTDDVNITHEYIQYVFKHNHRELTGEDDDIPDFVAQLGRNIGNFYNQMHLTSPFAYTYINALSTDVPPSEFANLTGISSVTISRAKKNHDNKILQTPTNINRSGPNKISDEALKRVVEWIKDICPIPSGSKYPKHHQFMTNKDLYLKYDAAREDNSNLPKISKSAFYTIRNTINIRGVSFDFTIACPWCNASPDDLLVDEDSDEEDDHGSETTHKKTLEEHLELKRVQNEEFRRIRSALSKDEILIVMDFTSAAVPYAKSQSLFVNDLIITIYSEGGRHDWINYMSTSDNKQMYAYVEGSLHDFFSTYIPENIKKVYVFSDGGPHHFKIWKSVNMFHYLVKLYEIPVEYHFFESYHGSSLCDGHAAHIKKAIRYLIRDGTKITELDVLMEKLKRLDLKNATFEKMCVLETSLITELKKVKGLKKMYKFVYDGSSITIYAKSSE